MGCWKSDLLLANSLETELLSGKTSIAITLFLKLESSDPRERNEIKQQLENPYTMFILCVLGMSRSTGLSMAICKG